MAFVKQAAHHLGVAGHRDKPRGKTEAVGEVWWLDASIDEFREPDPRRRDGICTFVVKDILESS